MNDYLQQHINSIINDDCLNVLRQLEDNCIDLTITDPPYGIKRDKGYNGFGTSKNRSRRYLGEWDNEAPSQEVFNEILRVSKNVVIFGGNYFTDKLPQSKHWDVWDKKGQFSFDNNFSDCELIYTNLKGNCNKFTVVQQGFVNDGDDVFHPTQKPERLVRMILKKYASDCRLIADFYSGSGTVVVVAKQEGFDFIGVEINKEFYDKSSDRINGVNSTGQTSIFTDFEKV